MGEVLKIDGAGQALRRLRESDGIALADLADRLGWDKGRLSKYETNQLGLSLSVIEQIAKAMGRRPEAVVLYCLKEKYPKLGGSEVGQLLDALVDEMGR